MNRKLNLFFVITLGLPLPVCLPSCELFHPNDEQLVQVDYNGQMGPLLNTFDRLADHDAYGYTKKSIIVTLTTQEQQRVKHTAQAIAFTTLPNALPKEDPEHELNIPGVPIWHLRIRRDSVDQTVRWQEADKSHGKVFGARLQMQEGYTAGYHEGSAGVSDTFQAEIKSRRCFNLATVVSSQDHEEAPTRGDPTNIFLRCIVGEGLVPSRTDAGLVPAFDGAPVICPAAVICPAPAICAAPAINNMLAVCLQFSANSDSHSETYSLLASHPFAL